MTIAPPSRPEPRGLLKGKTVIVTAAAGSGIGYSTAETCADEGAQVLISDMHEGRLHQYADRLAERIGQPVLRKLCNVTDEAQVRNLVAYAQAEMGRIDIMVNNAGLGGSYRLVDMTDEQWSRILDVNLTGTFRCMRAVLPVMMAQKGGVVINLGSIVAWRAEALQTAYAATKAGILAMTRCAAMEVARDNVRINAVVPSLALHPNLVKVTDPDFLADLIERNEAFGRAAETWEIANGIAMLASDYSSYMTGEALSVSCRHP
ncbi:putative oxidoreductase [Caenibius tardaugens NBRC 16725]|uniref:Putative oxidoreductase n=1 Tax=Caenibius tardaugens NBRC 16725 TaxID=1219035 RepID=U3A8L9_9SPHN|nr:SDR family oxidoreductase [Caenibius tardaugens]AZI35228.1 SDR family oxidoreductase [Caenibius tardaugens NBRC 16725]GAD51108.1 putative oxidoreductase [Caenibius tardaugens NBRC 16725]